MQHWHTLLYEKPYFATIKRAIRHPQILKNVARFSWKNVVNRLAQLLRKPACFPEVQTQLLDKTHLQWRFWEARELWHSRKGSLGREEKPFCDKGNCYMLPTYSADDSVICYWTGVSKYFIFLEHISGCAIYFYWKMSGHGSRLTKQPSKVSGSLGSQ